MKKLIPALLFSALIFAFLTTACGGLATPTMTSAEATALSSGLTMLPSGTQIIVTTGSGTPGPVDGGTGTAVGSPTAQVTPVAPGTGTAAPAQPIQTQGLPITGSIYDTRVLCTFCVDGLSHAMILLPAGGTYELVPPGPGSEPIGTTCTTVEQINGKQLLVCYGAGSYSFVMKVCLADKCSEFPVELTACPLPPEIREGAPGVPPGISPTTPPGSPIPPTSQPTNPPTSQPTQEPTLENTPEPTSSIPFIATLFP